jgi:hypothetical protein
MTFGQGVTDNLVNIRNGKVADAIKVITKELLLASNQGFGLASLKANRDRLEKSRLEAMQLATNKARRDALDPIKTEAREIAKKAPSIAETHIKEAKDTLVRMQMAEGWCRKFAKYLQDGLPDAGDGEEDTQPDISYLQQPSVETLQLITRLRPQFKTDAHKAAMDWQKENQSYGKALTRFTKEVLKPGLVKKVNALIETFPEGPEAKMKEALGPRFEQSLVDVVKTAEAFGVNNDRLSLGEQVAVFTYTKQDYKEMNAYLLGLAPELKENEKKIVKIKCDEAAAAIGKLEPYVGISTRGERDWPGADQQYVVGNEFAVKSFWSSGVGFSFGGKFVITIEGKSGRDVAGLSNSPNEAEILFAPGTKFRVVKREPSGQTTLKITVKEI